MRPERMELVGGGENTPEVFQPPFLAVEGPQRVALEVEEQIAFVGVGQHHQRLRIDDAVGRFAVDAIGDLQAGLAGQRRDGAGRQVGHGALVSGEFAHGRDTRVEQPGALADPHTRDQ